MVILVTGQNGYNKALAVQLMMLLVMGIRRCGLHEEYANMDWQGKTESVENMTEEKSRM